MSGPAYREDPGNRRPFRRQVLLNTASSGIANGWAMVVALASLPALLHGLGVEAFGVWVLLQTFSATNGWCSLADLGVVVATIREGSARAADGDLDGVRSVASSSMALSGALGLAAAALLVAIGPWLLPAVFDTPPALTHALRWGIVFLAVQIVLDLLINSVEASLEALQRVDLSRAVDIGRRTLVVGTASVTALVTGSLVSTVAAAAAATAVALAIGLVVLTAKLPRWRVGPTEARLLLREGRAIALLRPLGVVHRTMDRVIVGIVVGPAAVALVEIATQLQAAADAVLSAASYAIVPASSWLARRDDRDSIAELLERGTRYSLVATMPVVVAVATLSGPMVHVWLGRRYDEAVGLAVVAVLNIAIAAPISVGSQLLVGMGRAATVTRAAAVALLVNLVVTWVLVAQIGLVGAFLGTIASTVVITPLVTRAFLGEAGVSTAQFVRRAVAPVLPPVLAQMAVTLAVVALPWGAWPTLIVGGAAGLAAYCLVAWRVTIGADETRQLLSEVR